MQILAYLCSHKPSSIGPVRCGTVFFLPLLKLSPCTHHSTLTLRIIQWNNWKCHRLKQQYPKNTLIVFKWIWVTIDKESGLFTFNILKSMFHLKPFYCFADYFGFSELTTNQNAQKNLAIVMEIQYRRHGSFFIDLPWLSLTYHIVGKKMR